MLEIGSETLVLTTDMLVESIHVLPGADPADTAWKLVASNMSDLAAKGAQPIGVLLNHMLGTDDARFLEGLAEALEHFGAPLLGGDTVSGEGPRTFGLTAIGRARHTPVPARSGAAVGDAVYVTGPLGVAMMGFEAERDGTGRDSMAFRRPMARLSDGVALAPVVTAMMDISDGLLLDCWRMAAASSKCFAIDSAAVPLAAPEARRQDALRWGEDFELLFTAPAHIDDLPATAIRIGQVRTGEGLMVDGIVMEGPENLGYQH